MSDTHFQFLGLQRLASERGLDIRATVLRVATDLFCQNRTPTSADIARYTDLALPLLESADSATRAAVAGKLARAPHAPERLLHFFLNVADANVTGPILSHSQTLKLENLVSFLADCTPGEAAAVARRPDIDAHTIRALAAHPHLLVVEALLENTRIHFDAAAAGLLVSRMARDPGLLPLLFAHPNIAAADLVPLYPKAPANLRAKIRSALEQRASPPASSVPVEAMSALNDAVLAADRERIGAALVKALGLDPAGIALVLDDPTGELFAMALLAAGIKRAPAVNLLLIAAPDAVRTSVERIFAAADIYDATSRRVAREIVAVIAGERRPTPVFEPHMHPSGTPQRFSAAHRRPFGQLQQPLRRPDSVGNR